MFQFLKRESLRFTSINMRTAFAHLLSRKETLLTRKSAALSPPLPRIRSSRTLLEKSDRSLGSAARIVLERKERALEKASEKLELLSFENVLERGYAVVFSEEGKIIRDADALKVNQSVQIRLRKKTLIRAKITATEET